MVFLLFIFHETIQSLLLLKKIFQLKPFRALSSKHNQTMWLHLITLNYLNGKSNALNSIYFICLIAGSSTPIRHISLRSLIPNTDAFMTYEGSTTHPGCWESTVWIILNKPIYITKQEVNVHWAHNTHSLCSRKKKIEIQFIYLANYRISIKIYSCMRCDD